MIIIWGTKVNKDPRGNVADKCPVCMETERFAVTDHYEVSHLYYISLGQGTRIASTRMCWRCGTEFNCVPDGYDEYLPNETAEEMSLDALVERTNVPLARARDARKQLEEMASTPSAPTGETTTQMMAPGTPLRAAPASELDRELREALGRLEAYEGTGPEVSGLMAKLGRWRSLDATGRSALLQEVNAFIDGQQKIDRAAAFFGTMVQSFPMHLGCLPAIALLAVLGSAFWWLPLFDWHFAIGTCYAIVGLLLVFACYYYVTSALRRRWCRNVVIPQAAEAGVDLPTLVMLMVGVAQSPERIDETVRAMASEAHMLQQEAAALGRWDVGPAKLEADR